MKTWLLALVAIVSAFSPTYGKEERMVGYSKESWLARVPALRSGDERAFQFRAHIDAKSERLVAYVSWSPPDRRCVILCDSVDGLPLMIAVDGRAWMYDPIGGQILLIRSEPELIARVAQGDRLQAKWGLRADFPDVDSRRTINVDFASIMSAQAAISPDLLSVDREKQVATYKHEGRDAMLMLQVNDEKSMLPASFLFKLGTDVALRFDSFQFGAGVPDWHRQVDRSALAKRVPVVAVAEAKSLPADTQERLDQFKGLMNGGGAFILRPALRNDELRRAIEKNSPIKLNFDEIKANDERLRDAWRKALQEQGFKLPKLGLAQ